MKKISSKSIVIDSCILIYFHEDIDGGKTKELIDILKTNNNRIFISSVSGFEVLKNRQDSSNIEKYVQLLNSIDRIPVDSPVLMNAAILYHLYKKGGKIGKKNDKEDKIDIKDRLTGDLIIGGTVLSYQNYLLLTTNKKDFPSPYWKIITTGTIGQFPRIIKVYLMEPNMKEIIGKSEIPLTEPEKWPIMPQKHKYRG